MTEDDGWITVYSSKPWDERRPLTEWELFVRQQIGWVGRMMARNWALEHRPDLLLLPENAGTIGVGGHENDR